MLLGRLRWTDHIMRKEEKELPKRILIPGLSGRRGVGRSKEEMD
jgi:hypothetical protein